MRRFIFVGLLPFVVVGIGAAEAANEGGEQEKSASVWMAKKLDYSKEILAGITVADSDRVKVAAGHMRALNKVEAFVHARNPAYREQLKAFQDANEEILRRSEADDLEGAATAFSQMTTSCIRCHKVLRVQPTKQADGK